MQSEDNNTISVGGAIVVFAKCPIPGSSKTRLSPLLGAEGASSLAQAMLSDILTSISNQPILKNTLKVLCYAPKSGEAQMISILQSLNLPYPLIYDDIDVDDKEEQFVNSNTWILMPMKSTSADLTSSSLGDKLEDALVRTRQLLDTREDSNNEAVLFLGMDSPELPMEEIIHGLQVASSSSDENRPGKAHVCPANDGGYGLLSIPYHAPSTTIFKGVRWSHPLTALSQMKALTDNNIVVTMGKLMFDIDELNDVEELACRLIASDDDDDDDANIIEEETDDVLTIYTHGIGSTDNIQQSFPHHTKNQLIDLDIIQIHDGKHVVKVDNDREKKEDVDESTKVTTLQDQLRQAEHRATVLSDRLKIVKESGSSVIQSLNEELEDVAQHSAKVEAAMIKELSILDSKRREERASYEKRVQDWISLANNQKEDIDEYERKIRSLLSTVLMMGDDTGSDV